MVERTGGQGRQGPMKIYLLSDEITRMPQVLTRDLDVRYWHKADIGLRGLNISLGGKAGIMQT
jgi:hypothetical protein